MLTYLPFSGIQLVGLQYQLQVGLIARLVEHCTRITVTGSMPVLVRNVFHALREKTVCFARFTGISRSRKQG